MKLRSNLLSQPRGRFLAPKAGKKGEALQTIIRQRKNSRTSPDTIQRIFIHYTKT